MPTTDDETALVVAVADTHANSKRGLCPSNGFVLDDGSIHNPNQAQRKTWECWLDFWHLIIEKKRELQAHGRVTCYGLFVGDMGDRNTHDSGDLVSTLPADECAMVERILQPAGEAVDVAFMLRGTEAHAGMHASIEEMAAKATGCEPSGTYRDAAGNTRDMYSWWHLDAIFGGVLFDVQHHYETIGRRPWTKGGAPPRQSAIIRARCTDAGEDVPRVALRAHGHIYIAGPRHPSPQVFYLPPWQLTTPFGHRLGADGVPEPLGGMWFVCRGGRVIDWDVQRYRIKRREPWQNNSSS